MSSIGVMFWLMVRTIWSAFPSVSASNRLSPCHVVFETNTSQLVVTCSSLNLRDLPKDIYSERIIDMDLSSNHFETLAENSFVGLIGMRKLNISKCEIQTISRDTFKGLDSLKELDMKNNPFTSRGLPSGIFDHVPQLERLFVSGSVLRAGHLAVWGNLSSLTDIILTSGDDIDFTELAALPKLRSVYLVFSRFSSSLNNTMLLPLSNSNIKELALVSCDIKEIENGTFEGLHSLEVLNLAGNDYLSIDSVINALSSSNISVTTLILDAVGSRISIFVAGFKDRSSCRPAWKSVRRLSIRAINLVAVTKTFTSCLPNLEALAVGFNALAFSCGSQCKLGMVLLFRHLKYLDLSYFGISDRYTVMTISGYYKDSNWLLFNDDYFPEIDLFTSQECHPQGVLSIPENGNVNVINFMSCLSYLKAEHSFLNSFVNAMSGSVNLTSSHLKYVQISSRDTLRGNSIVLNVTIYGWDQLTILDLADSQITFANFDTFHNYPSLERLDISGNVLGKSELPAFSNVPHLKYLTMANNGIGSFRPDMFKRLISLRQLNLSRNHLIKLGFDLPPLLHQLDISGNLLTEIDADFQLKLGSLPLLVLNVDNNPLQCDCPEVGFIEWFQQQNVRIDNHGSVVCERGIQTYRINKINLSHLKLTCGLTLNKVVISICMCVLAFVLITSFGILYRFRWTLRWYYYSLRYKKRLRKQPILLGILNDDSEYSCYVIYPQGSDKARRFVCETLLPQVEEKLQKPRLFIKDRDEVVGVPCLDEMVRAILSSQTAIWIVCPDFFVDPYCEMAARFALHHLGPRNNMLIVLEKNLENYSIPKKFVNLMNPIFGVAHVHFKEDGTARRFFSAKLDDFIPAFKSSAK